MGMVSGLPFGTGGGAPTRHFCDEGRSRCEQFGISPFGRRNVFLSREIRSLIGRVCVLEGDVRFSSRYGVIGLRLYARARTVTRTAPRSGEKTDPNVWQKLRIP
jgi:hypothetical protein